jgi:hypothetical protein
MGMLGSSSADKEALPQDRHALRTGEPQTGIDEAQHFTALYSEPARFETFVNAMTAACRPHDCR